MRLDDVERAYKLLPDLADAERKLQMAQQLQQFQVLNGMGRELADYDMPSNIGVAFRKIKLALIELHEKELAGILTALAALGVEAKSP